MARKCRNPSTRPAQAQAHLTINEEQPYTAMITEINMVGGSNGWWIHLLRCLSHAGNHDVHTYHRLVKFHAFVPNTFASNLFMNSLFTTSQTQFGFSVFKQINSPNFFTFDIALFHVSHLNVIANISHVLTHMLRMSFYPRQ